VIKREKVWQPQIQEKSKKKNSRSLWNYAGLKSETLAEGFASKILLFPSKCYQSANKIPKCYQNIRSFTYEILITLKRENKYYLFFYRSLIFFFWKKRVFMRFSFFFFFEVLLSSGSDLATRRIIRFLAIWDTVVFVLLPTTASTQKYFTGVFSRPFFALFRLFSCFFSILGVIKSEKVWHSKKNLFCPISLHILLKILTISHFLLYFCYNIVTLFTKIIPVTLKLYTFS
jgi:hypothetical protein